MTKKRASWKTRLAIALFVVSIGWPVLVPALSLMGVSVGVTAAFSGFMVIAADLLLVAAAAIAGKEGYSLIRNKLVGWLTSYGPPQQVSRTRYATGLVLFASSLAFGWASPYIGWLLPGYHSGEWVYAAIFDALLLLSLFVLGGNFWDKLRALFQHRAVAVMPESHPSRVPATVGEIRNPS
ncbi:hypothetical protein MalM25_15740 [Planctomycetes bacterium MalM25]|nr:hypothetical protein MalM25_15740 [Planctomycetes bacterium MalM25]